MPPCMVDSSLYRPRACMHDWLAKVASYLGRQTDWLSPRPLSDQTEFGPRKLPLDATLADESTRTECVSPYVYCVTTYSVCVLLQYAVHSQGRQARYRRLCVLCITSRQAAHPGPPTCRGWQSLAVG